MIGRFCAILFVGFLLSSCATTGRFAGHIETSAEAQNGKTSITVLYPRNYPFVGTFDVYQEDRVVGEIAPGQYLTWTSGVTPDKRVFVSIKGLQTDIAVLNVDAGSEHFLEVKAEAGFDNSRIHIVPTSVENATVFMRKGMKDSAKKSDAVGK